MPAGPKGEKHRAEAAAASRRGAFDLQLERFRRHVSNAQSIFHLVGGKAGFAGKASPS